MCSNSSLPGQNGHRLADDPFNCIFVIGNLCIFIPILLKFVPKGLVDNNLALVQIMVWGWKCDKPLSEPMLTRFTDAYVWHQGEMNWPRLHSTMFWFKGDVTYWIVVWGFLCRGFGNDARCWSPGTKWLFGHLHPPCASATTVFHRVVI